MHKLINKNKKYYYIDNCYIDNIYILTNPKDIKNNIYLDSRFQNENNEIFTTYFSLYGSEEGYTFLDMMKEISQLKTPFFSMMRTEHVKGTKIAQIISGKIYKCYPIKNHYPIGIY